MNADADTDKQYTQISATAGRDSGKTFRIEEVPPVEMATFILRLLSAIRLGGVDELLELMQPSEGADSPAIGTVLRLLAGCDPDAVRALINSALLYVKVAPDVRHPGMFRDLRDDDIREMSTLGDVLNAFVRTNVTPA